LLKRGKQRTGRDMSCPPLPSHQDSLAAKPRSTPDMKRVPAKASPGQVKLISTLEEILSV